VRQIVALGGGGFSMERGNTLLDDYIAGLSGSGRARVCFVPTASGDADHYIVRFYRLRRRWQRRQHARRVARARA
jgi:dipeptidase E